MLSSTAPRDQAMLLVALLLGLACAPLGFTRQAAECALQAPDRAFLAQALRDWEIASSRHLRLPPAPLPLIVAFDATCTWQLVPSPPADEAGGWSESGLRFGRGPVLLKALRHGGMVQPPSGDPFPVSPRIYAAHSTTLGRAYFVLALPGVFAADPKAGADPLLRERLRSVVSHEILHTRQLPHVAAQVERLRRTFTLPPDIDDNIIERRFGPTPAFRSAWEKERDLLYAAVAETDPGRARDKAREAAAAMRARHAAFFAGPDAGFVRLEQLFLNLEGAAEWVRFKLHEHDHERFASAADIIQFIRGRQNDWVQDEGLAIVLLLDRFSGSWQERLLSPEMASPIDELERALAGTGR